LRKSPFGYTLRMIPRQCHAGELYRHRRLARQADDLCACGAVRVDWRHDHGAVSCPVAYPEFAYWTISGEAIFINMLRRA